MGAFDELSQGIVGEQTALLLYGVVRAVAVDSRFPPPPDHDRWDTDAVAETAHEFLADDGVIRMRKVAALATDDRSLIRVLRKAVRNWFSDRARQTVKGRLARAIVYRLELMKEVASLGGSGSGQVWVHSTGSGDEVVPPVSTLVDVAYAATPGAAARFALDPRRGAAMIDPSVLESLLGAVLVAAGGPLDTGTLVEIVTARFPAVDSPSDLPLDDVVDEPEPSVAPVDVAAVDQIWAQLTVDERRAISVLDLPVRTMAEGLGLSRNTAHRLAARTKTILAEGTNGREDAEEIAAELYARSAAMRNDEDGTDHGGLASTGDTGGDE